MTNNVAFYQNFSCLLLLHNELKGLYFPGLNPRVTYGLLKLGFLKVMGQDFVDYINYFIIIKSLKDNPTSEKHRFESIKRYLEL